MFEKLLNFFSENLSLIYFYFPLGVIGIWRWSVWLFKKITSLFYKLPQGNFQSTVSIVTPVYNEDPEMFQMALVSWKLNNPEEIIAVIDYTDEKCIKVFKKFSQNFSGAKLIITNIPGKRDALAKGIMEARSEIVALVDSDTIWSENLKNKLLAPFENPNVGGCAPRQDVLQATTLAKKFFRLHLFNRYGNDLIAQAAAGKALSCISGRTGFYRRRAIIDLLDDLVNEKFLGKRCISGDDKRLTHLIQSLGWQVVYVADALVYTPGFDSLWTFTKQQIRWTRNSWRADMKAIFSRWLWKNYFLAFHTIDRFFQPFSLLIGPVFLVISLIRGDWKIAIVLVLWWFFSRSIKFFSYLIRNPKDIAIIPLYTFYQYVLAVIKIYTLLTVDEQSWITRWSKNRISNSALFRKIPSYAATISIIFLIFFVSWETGKELLTPEAIAYQLEKQWQKVQKNIFSIDQDSQLDGSSNEEIIKKKEELLSKINTGGFGYYQTIWKDNLSKIKDKFFLPPEAEVFDVNKNSLNNNFQNFSGSILAIPVSSLRNVDARGYSLERINGNFQITRDLEENAIRIKNLGYQPAFVTLKQISQKLADKSLLEETDGKNWILRQNLYIDDQVTLVIDESEVSWLKLKSDRNGFVWIKAEKGNLVINKVKITSWDEVENNFDLNIEDGRSYILKKSSGRMDILESEIAYLGYFGHPNRGNPFGGPYGISWKIEDGMFGKELLSGSMKNSQIHHNLFGFYSFGATGIEITNNKIFDNIYYGIDPHDDSNNLLIENNQVYGNGNHGIIISKRCFNNIIRNNLSFNNRYHGIMLDRNSNNNLVEKNSSIGNVDGVALYESSENVVIENNLLNNQNGVRANHFSKNNYFGGNLIENSRYAIYIYKTSLENYIFNNKFSGNKKEIRIKEDSSGVVSYEKEKSNWLENQKTKKIATKKFGWK